MFDYLQNNGASNYDYESLENENGELRKNGNIDKTFTERKVFKYEVISGPYFPVFGLNTAIYSVNLRLQTEYRKIRTRNNFVFGHFSK